MMNNSMALALVSAGLVSALGTSNDAVDASCDHNEDPTSGTAEISPDSGYQGAEVTTMNTTTTEATATETTATETTTTAATKPAKAPKAPKPAKEKRAYPFMTKAQISANIENDFGFACMVITTLFDRQTAFEQETKSTQSKNRRGFMSSHAVHGTRIAQLLRAGTKPEHLTDEDAGRVQTIAPRYTKQMAEHFRDEAIEKDPTLADKAACFFTAQ